VSLKYRAKLISAGDVVEVYRYENRVCTGKDSDAPKTGRRGSGKGDKESKDKNRSDSLHRAKQRLRRQINANVGQYGEKPKFLTLTYADNFTDLEESNKNFNRFVKRLNYKLGLSLKYSVVVEFQKRGAVHYHLVTYNMPYVESSKIAEIWGHGFVKVNQIDQVDNIGAYVTKYMSKQNDDERLMGRKCHWSSRGLLKPQELPLETEKELEELRDSLAQYEVYDTNFENDYLGKIHYTQYNLKRVKKEMSDNSLEKDGQVVVE
jgi:hypothetical protein